MEIVRFAAMEIDDELSRDYAADSTIQSPRLIISYVWQSTEMVMAAVVLFRD